MAKPQLAAEYYTQEEMVGHVVVVVILWRTNSKSNFANQIFKLFATRLLKQEIGNGEENVETVHGTPDILIISLHHKQRTKWIFTTYMHTMYSYNVINYLSDCSLSAQFSCWCRSGKHFHDSTGVHTLLSLLHNFFKRCCCWKVCRACLDR